MIADYELTISTQLKNDDITRPGQCNKSCIYLKSWNDDTAKDICQKIQSIDDDIIREQTESFFSVLCEGIYLNGMSNLPSMYTSIESDEAYFEWIFDNMRFGFTFNSNRSESGWFVILKDDDSFDRFSSIFNSIRNNYIQIVEYILKLIRSRA